MGSFRQSESELHLLGPTYQGTALATRYTVRLWWLTLIPVTGCSGATAATMASKPHTLSPAEEDTLETPTTAAAHHTLLSLLQRCKASKSSSMPVWGLGQVTEGKGSTSRNMENCLWAGTETRKHRLTYLCIYFSHHR